MSGREAVYFCCFEYNHRRKTLRLANGITGFEKWKLTEEFVKSAVENGFYASLGGPMSKDEVYVTKEAAFELFRKIGYGVQAEV